MSPRAIPAARAMTLLEVLLSLALLSGLAAGMAFLIHEEASLQVDVVPRIERESAVIAFFEQVQDDLIQGDVVPKNEEKQSPRVVVQEHAVVIRTREPGRGAVE